MKCFWYEKVDSTMDEAKRLISSDEIKDTAFIVSDYQTNGRGTHGRKWDSPKDFGIYLSIVHLPGERKEKKYFQMTTLYTQACGVACVEAIKEVIGIQTSLKPVNDIYLEGKKLGGILVESTLYKEGLSSLITGIGINTHKASHNLDRDIVTPISLEECLPDFSAIGGPAFGGKNFSKKKLIEKIVTNVCFWYEKVFSGEEKLVKDKWEDYKIEL